MYILYKSVQWSYENVLKSSDKFISSEENYSNIKNNMSISDVSLKVNAYKLIKILAFF